VNRSRHNANFKVFYDIVDAEGNRSRKANNKLTTTITLFIKLCLKVKFKKSLFLFGINKNNNIFAQK
jgi:hypothetical protein